MRMNVENGGRGNCLINRANQRVTIVLGERQYGIFGHLSSFGSAQRSFGIIGVQPGREGS